MLLPIGVDEMVALITKGITSYRLKPLPSFANTESQLILINKNSPNLLANNLPSVTMLVSKSPIFNLNLRKSYSRLKPLPSFRYM